MDLRNETNGCNLAGKRSVTSCICGVVCSPMSHQLAPYGGPQSITQAWARHCLCYSSFKPAAEMRTVAVCYNFLSGSSCSSSMYYYYYYNYNYYYNNICKVCFMETCRVNNKACRELQPAGCTCHFCYVTRTVVGWSQSGLSREQCLRDIADYHRDGNRRDSAMSSDLLEMQKLMLRL